MALFNADANIQAIDLAAINTTDASLITAEQFCADPALAESRQGAAVSATDGGNNTNTNSYQVGMNGTPTRNLAYDLNGNMTSDGTNTYQWDAENRLVQINYPGSGKNSQFTYDGLDENVEIQEYNGGSLISIKQFVWYDNDRGESRDGSGTVLNRYFGLGQTSLGANYFYSLNHRGDVVATSNNSGIESSSTEYDCFGRPLILSGTSIADFGFTDLYLHHRSGLNLAVYRAYDPNKNRWLKRDPIEEMGGTNLYGYVRNNPVNLIDPSGQKCPCNFSLAAH